jgi:hypothetical protein
MRGGLVRGALQRLPFTAGFAPPAFFFCSYVLLFLQRFYAAL